MFHVLLCYSAFSDGQTNHMEKKFTIKTSLLNIQFTRLKVKKDQKMHFFGKRNSPFCGRSNQMGSNCCDTVPVAHVIQRVCWSVDLGIECRTLYMVTILIKMAGVLGQFGFSWKNFSGYIGWRLTMNNKSEPEGRRDTDQPRKPRTQLQKNSEFFEKLEQLEQK